MSIEDHVLTFLNTKGDKRFVAGAPYRLFEYNKLKKFWKELGLNKFDLAKCSAEWVNEMYEVISAVDKYQSNATQQQSKQPTIQRAKGSNKLVKTEKLL